MTSANDYNPVFVFLCSSFPDYIARDYLNTAKMLSGVNGRDGINHLQSSNFLLTTALELFLKIYIGVDECLNQKDIEHTIESIKDAVIKRTKGCGHNIVKCLDKSGLKNTLSILEAKSVSTDFVNDYRITLQNGTTLYFKDSESVRFGGIATNPDVVNMPAVYLKPETFIFVEMVESLVKQKHDEVINQFKDQGAAPAVL